VYQANWDTYAFFGAPYLLNRKVAKFGQSFIDFPPMQAAASFNLEPVKERLQKAIKAQKGNSGRFQSGRSNTRDARESQKYRNVDNICVGS
jgi:hypothetical protein